MAADYKVCLFRLLLCSYSFDEWTMVGLNSGGGGHSYSSVPNHSQEGNQSIYCLLLFMFTRKTLKIWDYWLIIGLLSVIARLCQCHSDSFSEKKPN